jgi:hypothetical protein
MHSGRLSEPWRRRGRRYREDDLSLIRPDWLGADDSEAMLAELHIDWHIAKVRISGRPAIVEVDERDHERCGFRSGARRIECDDEPTDIRIPWRTLLWLM